jgi:hypothetical protein
MGDATIFTVSKISSVPTDKNSLLLLGMLETKDKDGRTCTLGNGTPTLIDKDGERIAKRRTIACIG